LTIDALSDRTKLDAGTAAKVLDGEEGVDRRTPERFFQALSLEDYAAVKAGVTLVVIPI
jgi:hypothetical protein